MAALAHGGDRAGAIRQYRATVAMLERELGVAPLAETTELYEAIRDERVRSPWSPRTGDRRGVGAPRRCRAPPTRRPSCR